MGRIEWALRFAWNHDGIHHRVPGEPAAIGCRLVDQGFDQQRIGRVRIPPFGGNPLRFRRLDRG